MARPLKKQKRHSSPAREWETGLSLPSESTQEAYDRLADAYNERHLTNAELELVKAFRGRWGKTTVLELGCGAGRSAHTLGAIAKRYVGLDFSPKMIRRCKEEVGESDHVEFHVGDAADLSRFYGTKFDLVFFSFNGIDCVDRSKRVQIYQEVRKVLGPQGVFFFSSHALEYFPFKKDYPRFHPLDVFRWAQKIVERYRFHRRIARENKAIDFTAAREKGWEVVQDGSHDFTMLMYYTTVKKQIQDLKEAGFRVESLYDSNGVPCSLQSTPFSYWFHYLCKRK